MKQRSHGCLVKVAAVGAYLIQVMMTAVQYACLQVVKKTIQCYLYETVDKFVVKSAVSSGISGV